MARLVDESRVERAAALVASYTLEISELDGAPLREKLAWLMTDLRHLCRAKGIDFFSPVRTSQDYFDQELVTLRRALARAQGES